MTDSDFITLEQAAAIVPGFDREALKRLARRGILTVYRPGKSNLTTAADVKEAVQKCRVTPRVRASISEKPARTVSPVGLSAMEHGSAELDSALAQARARRLTR